MEKLVKKIKNISLTLFILNLLSLTWLFIDYLALKKIWVSTNAQFNFEWLMVILSAIPLALTVITIFYLFYYSLRLSHRFKADKKKEEKALAEESKQIESEVKKEEGND